MLFIDYGFGAREYYHPQRNTGTLMCHYRHHAHDDPFYPARPAGHHRACGFHRHRRKPPSTTAPTCSAIPRRRISCSTAALPNCWDEASPESERDYLPLSAQVQKLTSPAEMGELFKVIALGKGLDTPLLGFARGDKSHML